MPEYNFECEKCEACFEKFWKVVDYDENLAKLRCPSCKSRKVFRDFAQDGVYGGYVPSLSECKSVQQYAEKQTKQYGKEKTQKMIEGFKTEKAPDKELPNGMKRIKSVDDMKRYTPVKRKKG